MKKITKRIISLFLLFSLLCGITACGEGEDLPTTSTILTTTETEQEQMSAVTEGLSDSVVVWADSALEEMVRKGLSKPTGDIMESELSDIKSLRILGNSIVCIDDNTLKGLSFWELDEEYRDGYFIENFEIDNGMFSWDEWSIAANTKGKIKILEDMVHFPSLETLTISNHHIEELTGIQELKNLRRLELPNNNIRNTEGLSGLQNLERLDIRGNRLLLCENLSSLVHLRELTFESPVVEDVDFLSDLTEMKRLKITGSYISDAKGLLRMQDLEYLWMDSYKLKTSDSLADLHNLKELVLWTTGLEDIRALESLTLLESLSLCSGQNPNLEPLCNLQQLRRLSLSLWEMEGVSRTLDPTPISQLTELTDLAISFSGKSAQGNTDFLVPLSKLRGLDLGMLQPDLSSLPHLQQLEQLAVNSQGRIDLTPIASLNNLKDLSLLGTVGDISALSSLDNLVFLDLFCPDIRDISALSGMKKLEYLIMQENDIKDFGVLAEFPNLKKLDLYHSALKDGGFLSDLSSLEFLRLNLTEDSQFDPEVLSDMQDLRIFEIFYSGDAPDLRVLVTLQNLQIVRINNRPIADINEFAK